MFGQEFGQWERRIPEKPTLPGSSEKEIIITC